MKKVLISIVAFLLIAALFGCGAPSESNNIWEDGFKDAKSENTKPSASVEAIVPAKTEEEVSDVDNSKPRVPPVSSEVINDVGSETYDGGTKYRYDIYRAYDGEYLGTKYYNLFRREEWVGNYKGYFSVFRFREKVESEIKPEN